MTYRMGDRADVSVADGLEAYYGTNSTEQIMLLLHCKRCAANHLLANTFENGVVAVLNRGNRNTQYISEVHIKAFHNGQSR